MYSRLDHAVLAVRDLSEAERTFGRLGFHVVPGGQHPQWGTRNSLIFFDLTYLELVTVASPERARGTVFGDAISAALERGEGLVTAVLGSDDIQATRQALGSRGIPCGEPEAGERLRPDGSRVTWQNLFLPPPPGMPLAFAIQHGRSDPDRRADLEAAGALSPHRNGTTALLAVAWVAAGGAATAARFAEHLGLTAAGPEPDPALGSQVWRLSLPQGSLEVHQPDDPEGPAAQALAGRGEGAYALRLRVPELATARRGLARGGVAPRERGGALLVSPSWAHGAWLCLQP